jgi:hypothetical protein
LGGFSEQAGRKSLKNGANWDAPFSPKAKVTRSNRVGRASKIKLLDIERGAPTMASATT